jgi:hypothetical protein
LCSGQTPALSAREKAHARPGFRRVNTQGVHSTVSVEQLIEVVQPQQEAALLTEQLYQKPPLSRDQCKHQNTENESDKLRWSQFSKPGHSAWASTCRSLPDKRTRNECEGRVTEQRLAADRTRCDLAETVAIRAAAARQIQSNRCRKYEQQREGCDSRRPFRLKRKEGQCDGNFRDWQRDRERPPELAW